MAQHDNLPANVLDVFNATMTLIYGEAGNDDLTAAEFVGHEEIIVHPEPDAKYPDFENEGEGEEPIAIIPRLRVEFLTVDFAEHQDLEPLAGYDVEWWFEACLSQHGDEINVLCGINGRDMATAVDFAIQTDEGNVMVIGFVIRFRRF
jgi:hypothetical protein